MASLDLLERFRASTYREAVEVYERKPPRQLVASEDIIRLDGLGRRVVACPAGKSPPHWLELTAKEREALIVPPDPPPDGTLEPLGCLGFTPRNARLGFTIESGGTRCGPAPVRTTRGC
jgi:hypothetical protein